MKYLAPIPKQFVDQNGLPLSNGTVHVYISGDTQYANVYQDTDGEELMPNPARLDSNGAWVGFVTAGVPLDYVVEDKDGNVQFEYEKVVAGSGVANVAIEPVLTSGTKIAECWVDGELLELFAPEGGSYTANLPIKITSGTITNNGTGITCTGDNAWAEGKSNEATGHYSHVEGQLCKAKGQASHAGGQSCETSGQNSFAHGAYLKTSNQSSCQAAFGMYNSDQKAMLVIGNGTNDNNRKDAFKVDSNGDTWVMIGGVLTKVTNVSGGGSNNQFMLVRANMTTDFTNQEYQDCVDAVTAGQAVCVQFVRNDRTFQAQLTQVESDTGLLVFEIDVANIHITYEVSGTNNSHTITESDYQNGTPIFDTLQDAITWNAVLHNGDIFETNGFHTSGDGGAARYKVSSTGTANGMDIIQLDTGKVAIFQWSDEVHPEQLGAFGDGTTDDTSVFEHIINVFSSLTRDMQVKRGIVGSFGNRYKINNLFIHDCSLQRCVFKGLGSTAGIGLKLGSRAIIDRCILFDFKDAIYTGDGDSAISAIITGCTISWCGNGIRLGTGTSQQTSVDSILIEKNYISRMGTLGHSSDSTPPNWDNTGCGIWLNGNWKGVNIVNNVLEYNGYSGIRLQCDRTDLEPSCTITENYLEGNKHSAIRILMQNRPCAVSIFGNQMTKSDINVFYTTGIYCTKMMSSGEVESPYGEFIGVVTSNNGADEISLNSENLNSSNVYILPADLTNDTFELTPSKCSNSKSSRKVFHLELYPRASTALGLRITYKDKNGVSQTSNVMVPENAAGIVEIPMTDVNLYDAINQPITCEVTSSSWFYILITDMWIK